MDIFFAFVILLNASLLIAGGYYVWKAPDFIQRMIEDAVRKQDDRLRKRYGVVNDGKQTPETSEPESRPGPNQAREGRQTGRPFRRRAHTDPGS